MKDESVISRWLSTLLLLGSCRSHACLCDVPSPKKDDDDDDKLCDIQSEFIPGFIFSFFS